MEKNEKGKNIVIGILIGIIVCLVIALIFISYNKFVVKNKVNTDSNNNTTENSNQAQTQTKSIFDGVNVTKESLENFLSLMVGYEKWPYDNIGEVASPSLSKGNHATFERIIRILIVTNKYEKINDNYYFKLDDVNDIARKYFNKKNFNYDATEGLNYVFNKETNKYESMLAYGLFEDGPISYEKPMIKDFQIANDIINVQLVVITNYGVDNIKVENNYVITLGYEDNSYVIKSIEKSK